MEGNAKDGMDRVTGQRLDFNGVAEASEEETTHMRRLVFEHALEQNTCDKRAADPGSLWDWVDVTHG